MKQFTVCLPVLAALLAAMLPVTGCQSSAVPTGFPLEGLSQIKPGHAMRSSTSDPNWKDGNGDARPIAPGQTLVLADLKGPGQVTHLWNTVAAQERGYSRLLVLRMYWDGEATPSVEAPLGDFFAMGHGIDHPFSSLPVTVSSDGRARNCYWPMPFGKSARVTVTNEGTKKVDAFYSYVDWQKLPKLPAKTAYFHAQYRQEHPAVMGHNYRIADLAGRGHYVGTVLSVRQLTPSWWGEGDDFWFIDGEKEPSLRGTGSEDYLCDGWGLREMSQPYYGAPLMEGYDAFARTTTYRWHIADPVPFEKSLRLEIEHKGVTFNEKGEVKSGFEERPDDFSSVAFWYQMEPHRPFPPMAAAKDRLYYDWTKLVETETRLADAKASEGNLSAQEGGAWGGGKQLFWTPSKPGQTLELNFDLAAAGNYELLLVMTKSFDYGNCQVEIDGRAVGAPLRLYSKDIVTKEIHLDAGALAAGTHTLRFVNRDKDPESKGWFLGFDSYMFQTR